MENDVTISRRKSEHLRIVAEEEVKHRRNTMLGDIILLHCALPELDLRDIRTEVEFFGKKLKYPLMITGMTGGAEFAGEMNRGLAETASEFGIAFGVGSQRVIFRHPEMKDDFAVRKWIPDGVLLGNIGAGELREYPLDAVVGLMDDIEADGICVHLNAAQELIQDEGHRDFRGLLDALAALNDKIDGKVMVKETGAGIDPESLKKLSKIGIKYLDVSGAGGTSWTKVEMYRAADKLLKQTGKTFSDWGIPTAFSLIAARRIRNEKACIMASGGIENGLDAARAIAVGADIAGFARPILLSFLDNGKDGAAEFMEQMIHELKTAMLLTGAADLTELKRIPRIFTGELREWLLNFGWLDKQGI